MSIVNNEKLYNTTIDYNNQIINDLTDTESSFKNRIDKSTSSDIPLSRSKRGTMQSYVDDVKKEIRKKLEKERKDLPDTSPMNSNSIESQVDVLLEEKAKAALRPLTPDEINHSLPAGVDVYVLFGKALNKALKNKNPILTDTTPLKEWDGKRSTLGWYVLQVKGRMKSYIDDYTAHYQFEHQDESPETARYRATWSLFDLLPSDLQPSDAFFRAIRQSTGREFLSLQRNR